MTDIVFLASMLLSRCHTGHSEDYTAWFVFTETLALTVGKARTACGSKVKYSVHITRAAPLIASKSKLQFE